MHPWDYYFEETSLEDTSQGTMFYVQCYNFSRYYNIKVILREQPRKNRQTLSSPPPMSSPESQLCEE